MVRFERSLASRVLFSRMAADRSLQPFSVKP
jgi:hypothetical protein